MKRKLCVVFLLLIIVSCATLVACDETTVPDALNNDTIQNIDTRPECEIKGHNYVESISKEATCIALGEKKFTCSICADEYTETFEKKKYSPTELFDLINPSVVEINTFSIAGVEHATGSGFIIEASGKIVTNYHVIENASSAKVNVNGVVYNVDTVVAYDKEIDIAVLKIDATNLTPVVTCSETIRTGATVYAVGSSKGLEETFSNGMVTHSSRDMDGVACIQHNAAISSGNSGGPLINEYGEVIGINTFTLKDSQNLNFAIKVEELNNIKNNTPMTLADVFLKETDPVIVLALYTMAYGEYDGEDLTFEINQGIEFISNGTLGLMRFISVDFNENEISLGVYYKDNNGTSGFVTIFMEDSSGYYTYTYYDDFGFFLYGNLNAHSFTNNTLVGYTTTNINDYSLLKSVRGLASSLITYILNHLTADVSGSGLTVQDFGFVNFR